MPWKPCSNSRYRVLPGLLDTGRQAVAAALGHLALRHSRACLLAVDATCGNGNDTLFLARSLEACCAGNGDAYGILSLDVQQAALDAASALLRSSGCAAEAVHFTLAGHQHLDQLVGTWLQRKNRPVVLAAVMYNLGFLPRSDKRVTTMKESTLVSLAMAAEALVPEGLVAIHAYGGHAGGYEELEAVDDWCAALPHDAWQVFRHTEPNKRRNPEALHLIRKRNAR